LIFPHFVGFIPPPKRFLFNKDEVFRKTKTAILNKVVILTSSLQKNKCCPSPKKNVFVSIPKVRVPNDEGGVPSKRHIDMRLAFDTQKQASTYRVQSSYFHDTYSQGYYYQQTKGCNLTSTKHYHSRQSHSIVYRQTYHFDIQKNSP
jgi:hypothetical protein